MRTTLFGKERVILCLLTALLVVTALPALANDAELPALSPENPAFIEYQRQPCMESYSLSIDTNAPSGLIPEPVDLSHLRSEPQARVFLALPSSYDLRTTNKLTPVRDQGGCGSCWAFASMGSVESSLKPGEAWDFSENNLKNKAGFDISCCSGGNRTMSTAYLVRWAGAIAEADDPYNAGSCWSPTGLTPKKHIQNVLFVPVRTSVTDNDAIKQAVMTYGAVYTTYYHSGSYYKSSTYGYYYNGSSSANHAVCIVGWDDNFDKSRFNTPAPGNGAFIVRNSWGTWWGQSGYFYMSYYDNRLGKSENAVFLAESATNYDTIYQYDDLGWISSTGYGSDTAWFANVFTAKSDEYVSAAAWYAAAPGSSYEIRVYTNPTSGPVNSAGPASVTTGCFTYAGYQTVPLATPVPAKSGQKFSVVVKVTTPGYRYPVPIEIPYSGYSSAAVSSPGQSYISSTGTSWSDLTTSYSNANVCLKAFTKRSGGGGGETGPGSMAVTSTSGLSATGPAGGPFTPSSITYTVTNPGQSAINWTASKTAGWITLSASSGTLNAGQATTVQVSINSAANSLAGGSYSDSIVFINATNGSGNTSRGISLNVTAVATDYIVDAADFAWVDPLGHKKITLSDNSVSAAYAMPFYFSFYGKSYNRVYIGSNGALGFVSTGLTYYSNTDLPRTARPNAVLYPYWDDLNPYRGGGVYVGVTGSAPNRRLAVTWSGVPHRYSSTTKFSFQAVLCEESGDIYFQYLDVSPASTYGGGRSATIGIENELGTKAVKIGYNTYGSVTNMSAFRIHK